MKKVRRVTDSYNLEIELFSVCVVSDEKSILIKNIYKLLPLDYFNDSGKEFYGRKN